MRTWSWLPGLAAFVRRQVDQELKNGRVRQNTDDIETAFSRMRELREAVEGLREAHENLAAVVERVELELKNLKGRFDLPPPPPLPPENGSK